MVATTTAPRQSSQPAGTGTQVQATPASQEQHFEQPNFTMIPNVLFDSLMAKMDDSELRVTLALCRKLFGWHKARDHVSRSQLIELTGLSKNGVITGIEKGIQRGTIQQYTTRTPNGEGYAYSLRVRDASPPTSTPAQLDKEGVTIPMNGTVTIPMNGTGSLSDPLTGSMVDPVPGHSVTPQNKGLNKREIKEGEGGAADTANYPQEEEATRYQPPTPPTALSLYLKTFPQAKPGEAEKKRINQSVVNLQIWEETLEHWQGNNYKPSNIAGLIDYYTKAEGTYNRQYSGDKHQRPASSYSNNPNRLGSAGNLDFSKYMPGGKYGARLDDTNTLAPVLSDWTEEDEKRNQERLEALRNAKPSQTHERLQQWGQQWARGDYSYAQTAAERAEKYGRPATVDPWE